MWLNVALASMVGILIHQSFETALLISLVLIYRLWRKEQLLFVGVYALPVIILTMIHQPLVHTSFDWTDKGVSFIGTGVFKDDINVDGDLLSGTIHIEGKDLHFNYFLTNEKEKHLLLNHMPYFNHCDISADISRPLPNTNGLKFNYDIFLKSEGIEYTARIKQFKNCRFSTLNVMEHIQRYRVTLSDRLIKYESANMKYMIALTLGDIRYLSSDELNRLKDLGIYHLYAISGSHVALISVQLFYCLKRCYVPLIYGKIIILFILPIYAVFTGLSPSVLRAVLFIMIYLIFKRWMTLMDALCVSFIVFITFDSNLIFDVGFQLSYLLSFSLIFTADLFERKRPLTIMIFTTVISQLITIPLLLMRFNSFQLVGFLTNIVFIPLFTLIIFPICTLGLLSEMIFHYVPSGLLLLIDTGFSLNHLSTSLFSRSFTISSANIPVIACIGGTLVVFVVIRKGYVSLQNMLVYSSLLIFIIWMVVSWPQSKERVSFIDVGQGDAILLESGGQTMLIDTGGKVKFNQENWRIRRKESKLSEQTILPLMKERGIKQLDYLLITHPDTDHFGEAVNILRNMRVKNLIVNKRAPGVEKYDVLQEFNTTTLLDSSQIREMKLGHAAIKLYNQQERYNDENDSSIVTKVELGKRRYLLMGDLPVEGEKRLKEQLCGKIDVLKVGHHGSDTSTSNMLLDCTKPRYAVISAGRNNRFSHPHTSVVDKLKNNGMTIFNTQNDGMITFDEQIETVKEKIKTVD